MWSISLLSKTLSVNFEIKDKLEIGRKLFMTSLSREGSLFIVVGTLPVDIDKLTMFVMVGRRQVKYSFSSQVGTRSSEHDVEGFLLRLLLQERERLVYRPLHLDYPRSWGRP